MCLEISSSRLLHFNRFKKRLEISFAEATAAFALDDLEENGGTILDWLREDLQEVTFFVAVNEYAKRT